MNLEDFRTACLEMPCAEENAPWKEPQYQNLITYTVAGKWFVLLDLEEKRCNLKASPEIIVEMQERYEGACPAWHMNKNHWLGVKLESDIPETMIRELIIAAYNLIVKKLSRRVRQELSL